MLFEEMVQKHDRKEITILCRKLANKFSFTRSSDVTLLCELAYRLYVVGDKESVLQICEYSNIDIPSKIN